MRRVKVLCTGISPLLMDPMSEETLEGIRTGNSPPQIKDRDVKEVAAGKIYRDDQGRIGLPVEMLFACLVGGGRKVKIGKTQLSTATTTCLPEYLSLNDFFLPFIGVTKANEKSMWKVDKRRGVGQTGVAVCIVRPRFEQWSFEVIVEHNERTMNEKTLRKLFEVAGTGQGLGSFRPSKKGPFGRFGITSITDITPTEWLTTNESEDETVGDEETNTGGNGDSVVALPHESRISQMAEAGA